MQVKKDYYEYQFTLSNPDVYREILIAVLSSIGFEGFTETNYGILAYTDKQTDIKNKLQIYNFDYQLQIKKISPQNWNRKWEQIIQPLIIENQVYIKTSFHPDKKFPYTIHIDPKMSFGTGHHETTELMIRQMLSMNLKNKTLIDMGAGTGILSILAEQMGANKIIAVDIDQWAYENMKENFSRNHTKKCQAYWGGAELLKNFDPVDIVLANINLNVLLENISKYKKVLKPNGLLLLSGFLDQDIPILKKEALKNGIVFEKHLSKNIWQSLLFKNTDN